jgi:hypothetical protein
MTSSSETLPGSGETVDMRRLVERVWVICADVHIAQVIDQEENEIRSNRLFLGGLSLSEGGHHHGGQAK